MTLCYVNHFHFSSLWTLAKCLSILLDTDIQLGMERLSRDDLQVPATTGDVMPVVLFVIWFSVLIYLQVLHFPHGNVGVFAIFFLGLMSFLTKRLLKGEVNTNFFLLRNSPS